MCEDNSLRASVGGHWGYIPELEAVLFQNAANFGDGLSDESRAEVNPRFLAAGDQQVHRGGADLSGGGRGILRYYLVRVARQREDGDVSHRKTSLNGRDAGSAHAIAYEVRYL